MHWLYNSEGQPIVMVVQAGVWTIDGEFFGILTDGEIWYGDYLGEVRGDRLFVNRRKKHSGGRHRPPKPGEKPLLIGRPGPRSETPLPYGYEDVAF